MTKPLIDTAFNLEADTEWRELLHPAAAFSHPSEVLSDPDLAINEKRAILASWASDACAVEAVPSLREPSQYGRIINWLGPGNVVKFDDIMDALRSLDAQAKKGMRRLPSGRNGLGRVTYFETKLWNYKLTCRFPRRIGPLTFP